MLFTPNYFQNVLLKYYLTESIDLKFDNDGAYVMVPHSTPKKVNFKQVIYIKKKMSDYKIFYIFRSNLLNKF